MRIFTKINTNRSLYKKEINERGLKSFIRLRFQKVIDVLLYFIISWDHNKKTFKYNNIKYSYLTARYNYTWNNERTIEIPIAMSYLKKYRGKKVLEVGNVLSHYYAISHDVVDKYEAANGIINKDIVTYLPRKNYDLILAISTLEHVGWEESPREPKKIHAALTHLKKLLRKDGEIIITLPIGYTNPFLNELIANQMLGLTKSYYLKRISWKNDWQQVDQPYIKDTIYNSPYPNANAIIVGIIKQ